MTPLVTASLRLSFSFSYFPLRVRGPRGAFCQPTSSTSVAEDPAVGPIAGRTKTEMIDDPLLNLLGIVAENPELLLGWTP
jgi:hypothetical protein